MQFEIEAKDGESIKEISFSTYQTYMMSLLNVADNPPILFYRKEETGVKISFGYQQFIIVCFVSYQEIVDMYQDQNMNVADVTLSDKTDHPFLIKFYADYLFKRGIPER